ncbi:MAG: hypothetical protein AAFU79_24390 [Myxococcota bacterium]
MEAASHVARDPQAERKRKGVEVPTDAEKLGQGQSLDIVHHHIGREIILAVVEHPHDVGMIDRPREARLLGKHRSRPLVPSEVRVHVLYSIQSLESVDGA